MTFEKKMPTMNINIKPQDKDGNKIDDKNQANNNVDEQNLKKVELDSNDEMDDLKKQIDELTQKNKNLEEKLLYLAAELQNTKKRNVIELENANKFAINKFAIDAVGIYDVLETALQNVDIKTTDQTLFNGIKMTINEFNKMFDRLQIIKIKPEIGSVFDHNKHEAISRVQNELEAGCIVKVVRVGYELYGRLLRPAMVVVSGGQ